MNYLEVECNKCLVSKTCPHYGSSPSGTGKNRVLCRLIGGYGRTPIPPNSLSKTSLERSLKDGPCLTIAEIPYIENGVVGTRIAKIFSKPVLHPREASGINPREANPRSYQ